MRPSMDQPIPRLTTTRTMATATTTPQVSSQHRAVAPGTELWSISPPARVPRKAVTARSDDRCRHRYRIRLYPGRSTLPAYLPTS